MSLMSVVEFFELALDLIIYVIIHCCASMKARRQSAAQQGAWNVGGPSAAQSGGRLPWEAPPADSNEFAYRDRGPPPSYRAATRMSRAYPNDVRDVLLNM